LCPAGQQYEFKDSGYVCLNCTAGFISNANSIQCTACPAGFFSDPGQQNCTICPINFYSEAAGSPTCLSCGAGQVNGQSGTTVAANCFDPLVNFVLGFITLGFSIFIVCTYFINGRIQKIAFQRKFRLTNKVMELFGTVEKIVDLVTEACMELNTITNKPEDKTTWWQEFKYWFLKPVSLITLAAIIVPAVTCLYISQALIKVIFNTMVLWRAYKMLYSNNFVDNIKTFLSVLDVKILRNLQVFRVLGYPVVELFNILTSIQINLPAVDVTCPGAQTPAFLLGDLLVFCLIVMMIESNFQLLWTSVVLPCMTKIRSMVFNRFYVSKNPSSTFVFALLSIALSCIPEPVKFIQYCLGFLKISVFFAVNGRAAYSTNCDGAINVNGNNARLDSVLAYGATFCVYASILPALYVFSEVLTASADVDKVENDGIVDESQVKSNLHQQSFSKPSYRLNKEGAFSKTIRILSMWFSFDWFFFRCVFAVGKRALGLYLNFLTKAFLIPLDNRLNKTCDAFSCGEYPRLREIRGKALKMKAPYLPWFDATVLKYDSKSIKARSIEVEKWKTIKEKIPTYLKLSIIVQDELTVMIDRLFDRTHKGNNQNLKQLKQAKVRRKWIHRFTVLICWIPLIHFITARGRQHWYRVLRSYAAIILASCGIWPDFVFDEMKLKDKFEAYEERVNASDETLNQGSQNRGALDIFTRLENDPKLKFPQFLYATITSRLAILQVVKYATIWTTFAIDISSCPILVMPGSKMIGFLPPFIDWNAWEYARELLQQEAGNQDEPNRALHIFLCVFIFVRRSRLVEFVIKAFLNSVACCISFFPEYLDYFAPAMFGILALQGLLYATQVFVLLNRLLYPINRSQRSNAAVDSERLSNDVEMISQTLPLELGINSDPEDTQVDVRDVDLVDLSSLYPEHLEESLIHVDRF
jgi:hypothetical protein